MAREEFDDYEKGWNWWLLGQKTIHIVLILSFQISIMNYRDRYWDNLS